MGLSDSYRDLGRREPPERSSMTGNTDLDGSLRTVGSVFSGSTSSTQSKLDQSSRVSQITWKGKLAFGLILAAVGLAFAFSAFFLFGEGEADLGELQYEAMAERASIIALQIMERKRLGLLTLSSVISGANPDARVWPQVQLTNFEVIANNLMKTADDYNMGFAPFVTPEQVESFEKHSYDFYETNRSPEPFPEGTAISPFGKGIYAVDPSTSERFHDTTGEVHWNSPNRILTPLLHHSGGPEKYLLSNLHADEALGSLIDGIIDCANSTSSLDDCTILSSISPNIIGWKPYDSDGAWGILLHPVYAQRSPETLSGLVLTSLRWSEIFNGAFANSVSGVYAVLEANDGSSYTYVIQEGQAVLLGEGDLHDTEYNDFRQETNLESKDRGNLNFFGEASVSYTLVLYPSEEFFDSFSTANPMLSSIGVVMILVVTSALFVMYDVLIRREYLVKKDLVEAKRKFIRFVSHEVRTPLNSVHMGLTVLRGELEAKYETDDAGPSGTMASRRASKKFVKTKTFKQLVSMADEIAMNCNGAVDILNDFINFDKLETDKLTLDLSILRLFDQIESISKEFKMVAKNNKIKMTIVTPLHPNQSGKAPKECFTVGDSMQLTHVFRNLLANALETTPDDGKVEVVASWHPNSMKNAKQNTKNFVLKDGKKMKVKHNGFMNFVVADTGKGMTQAQIRRLLHKGLDFNVNRLQAGNASGLGLWVAKGIVMRHGGTLTAHSHGVGKGSVFTVSLPTYDIDDPKPKGTAAQESVEAKDILGILKVLVVDDAKMNLKLLMRLVSKKGHKVDGAEDGAIAVDKASKAMDEGADFDVILMDYQMPNMDGPTATRILRSKGCNAFICGVTGNVMAEDIKHFKKCGANAVLHKPAKMKALEDLWIEYGVRGEFPLAEGAHDGEIEQEPKREIVKRNASDLSLSISSLGKHSPSTRVNMAGNVLDGSAKTPDYPSGRKTLGTGTGETSFDTDSDDLWASRMSLKSGISSMKSNISSVVN
ncbi:unnamed protein product [Cylindrotheca closterium]|uniref:histidine kinase n=1 Tax=Cylindrotheca closterium TaxID=2856 RepID=A0AAD2JGD8_9STRA|nr:unnamed protein product [Cylindrotheca closterium]